ncbi:MAG: hypothetical protein SFV23_19900 [Planctomycetaceae bacterium]|nr:hypothetical protein [Planctomycetaceae bacterium]
MVYASTFKKTETADDGQVLEAEIPFLKEYTVFCADQCAGLPQHFYATVATPKESLPRIEHADRFFANIQADIRTGGDRA